MFFVVDAEEEDGEAIIEEEEYDGDADNEDSAQHGEQDEAEEYEDEEEVKFVCFYFEMCLSSDQK